MAKRYEEMSSAEKTAHRISQNRAIEARIAERRTAAPRCLREVRVAFIGKKATGFSHSDTFPIIASVIATLCGPENSYVGHRDIVAALTTDGELGWLLDEIVAKDPRGRKKSFWTNSMMSWFSQKITERENSYADGLERHPTAHPYQYRRVTR
jgi:hypothetical protein